MQWAGGTEIDERRKKKKSGDSRLFCGDKGGDGWLWLALWRPGWGAEKKGGWQEGVRQADQRWLGKFRDLSCRVESSRTVPCRAVTCCAVLYWVEICSGLEQDGLVSSRRHLLFCCIVAQEMGRDNRVSGRAGQSTFREQSGCVGLARGVVLPAVAPKVYWSSNQMGAMTTSAGAEVPPFALACLDGTDDLM